MECNCVLVPGMLNNVTRRAGMNKEGSSLSFNRPIVTHLHLCKTLETERRLETAHRRSVEHALSHGRVIGAAVEEMWL